MTQPSPAPAVNRPLIGAHVASSGGISRAIDRACDIGANCLQIFASAPQQWRAPSHPDAEVDAFCFRASERSVHPVFLHAIYLLNPSGPDEALRLKSVDSMRKYLEWGARLKAEGVVIHLGSSNGTTPDEAARHLCESILAALRDSPPVPLLLETSAGTRNSMGSSFRAIGSILRSLDVGDRAAVCLDTAHVWAAGYDVASRDGLERTVEEFDREIGLDRLSLIHANDSKVPLGGARDLHADIGAGHIGVEGWRVLLGHPALRYRPWIMETPGLGKPPADVEQVRLLINLWHGREVAVGPAEPASRSAARRPKKSTLEAQDG